MKRSSQIGCLAALLAVTWATAKVGAVTLAGCRPRAIHPRQPTEIELTGTQLRGERGDRSPAILWTSFAADVELLPAPPEVTDVLRYRILPTGDSPPAGIVAVRAYSNQGVSDPLWLAVDDLPSVRCQGHHDAQSPQPLQPPCAVDGDTENLQKNFYRFHARTGDRVAMEILAERLGSPMDAILVLRDSTGRELAYSDDARGRDPRLTYVFSQDGDYLLEVYDVQYRGGMAYRLRLGDFPLVSVVYPAGVRRGQPCCLNLVGADVPPSTTINTWFAANAIRGVTAVSCDIDGHTFGSTASVVVSPDRQFLEIEPNGQHENATAITLPCGLNGRFAQAGDRDVFMFNACDAQWITLWPSTLSLGTPVSIVARVTDAAGNIVAATPDGYNGERPVSLRVSSCGNYFLTVEDLFNGHGQEHVYHLELTTDHLPVELTLKPSLTYLGVPSGRIQIPVSCQRRGYNGAIKLTAAFGDRSFEAAQSEIPAEKNEAILTVRLPSCLPTPSLSHVTIRGVASEDGQGFGVQVHDAAQPSVRIRELPTVAIIKPPLQVRVASATFTVTAGSNAIIPLQLEWAQPVSADKDQTAEAAIENKKMETGKRAVTLTLESVPAGCKLGQKVLVEYPAVSAEMQVVVNKEAEPGTYPGVLIVATVQQGGRPVIIPGGEVTLQIPAVQDAHEL